MLLATAALMAGAASASPFAQVRKFVPVVAPAPVAGEYRIGPEDQLDIVAYQNVELTRNVRVRPDGKISLPLVNDIQAADLTPLQLRAAVTNGLGEFMDVVPEISVIVGQVHTSRASVLGNVNTPGRIDLGSRTTVLEALAMTGGFNTYAKRDRVLIHRQGTTLVFNYDKAVNLLDFKDNIVLLSGDIIIVP
jgi:polysaccharide biosynthesis/export protein